MICVSAILLVLKCHICDDYRGDTDKSSMLWPTWDIFFHKALTADASYNEMCYKMALHYILIESAYTVLASESLSFPNKALLDWFK